MEHLADIDLSTDLYYHLKVKFEDKEESMNILKDQTVKELKKLLQNFCGIPYHKMVLFGFKSEDEYLSEIKQNTRSLHSYRCFMEIDELHIYSSRLASNLKPARVIYR